MKEMVGGCCVCSDDRGWAENPLVYCDGQGCNVAVHQACYGIVTVPTGPWFCRKCESQERAARVGRKSGVFVDCTFSAKRCELCPSKDGALKCTDNGGWAHVVCALYIPEVCFGNVTSMEPIILALVPKDRFTKACYICEEQEKESRATVGACMQCNKSGCKQHFHVTCAQALGLLCEEAGNYLDNVKYCGYCQYHYSKLKKTGNVKIIPAYKPIRANDVSEDEEEEEEEVTGRAGPGVGAEKDISPPVASAPGTSAIGAVGTTPPSADPGLPGASVIPKAEPGVVPRTNSGVGPKRKGSKGGATSAKSVSVDLQAPVLIAESSGGGQGPGGGGSTPTGSSKFTTANFTETSVTPGESVFGSSSSNSSNSNSSSSSVASSVLPVTVTAIGVTLPKKGGPPKKSVPVVATTPEEPVALAPLPTQDIPPRLDLATLPDMTPSTPSMTPSVVVTPLPPQPEPASDFRPGAFSSIAMETEVVVKSELMNPGVAAAIKRPRSQSNEKIVRARKQKRATVSRRGGRGGGAGARAAAAQAVAAAGATILGPAANLGPTTPTPSVTPTPVMTLVRESPPSSPGSEAASVVSSTKRMRRKKDEKDPKSGSMFPNGLNPPHMLGNALNPSSTMAQKMSDTLSAEMEAHGMFTTEGPTVAASPLIGPPFPGKHHPPRMNTGGSGMSGGGGGQGDGGAGGGGSNSGGGGPGSGGGGGGGGAGGGGSGGGGGGGGSGGGGGGGGGSGSGGGTTPPSFPQSLEQLLERQWEQGSQFLMEQAQHFDIASLLSCLHQLRQENQRLEDHVTALTQRRDHLLAVNARLAIPLNQHTNSSSGGVGAGPGTSPSNSSGGGPGANTPNPPASNTPRPNSTSSSSGGGGGLSQGPPLESRSPRLNSYVPLENGVPEHSYPPPPPPQQQGGYHPHQHPHSMHLHRRSPALQHPDRGPVPSPQSSASATSPAVRYPLSSSSAVPVVHPHLQHPHAHMSGVSSAAATMSSAMAAAVSTITSAGSSGAIVQHRSVMSNADAIRSVSNPQSGSQGSSGAFMYPMVSIGMALPPSSHGPPHSSSHASFHPSSAHPPSHSSSHSSHPSSHSSSHPSSHSQQPGPSTGQPQNASFGLGSVKKENGGRFNICSEDKNY